MNFNSTHFSLNIEYKKFLALVLSVRDNDEIWWKSYINFQASWARDMFGNPGYFLFYKLGSRGWLGEKAAKMHKICMFRFCQRIERNFEAKII